MSDRSEQLISPQHINRDQAEILLEKHFSMAKRVVNSFIKANPSSLDKTELLNSAMLGLITAINRFNPAKGDDFGSYARIRIRGALLDKVRQEDSLSRGLRNFVNAMEAATDKLVSRLYRSPTSQEIAEEMKLSLDKFEQLMAEIGDYDLDLDQADRHNQQQLCGGKVSEVLDFEDRDPLLKLLNFENSILIEKALLKLNPKQRLCIKLSFYEDLPLTRIAQLLEVSLSRVSQIRTESLALLKMELQKYQ